ncbi:MAG: hypothetical protein HY294_04005 [Candidatus Rokubacteria bacterium]|nr:hypothetical protein [Candidatus Rokubacteria bacterium]
MAFELARHPASHAHLAGVITSAFVLRDADLLHLFGYVDAHPRLAEVLLEAPSRIVDTFGPVRAFIDFVNDPEDGWEQLFIVVPTGRPVVEALRDLDRIDRTWARDAARRAGFSLSIDVE